MNNDLISRQQAFDALHCHFADGFEEDRWWNSTHVIAALKELPSIQPDIIRCKDCKHRDPEDKKCDCGHDIQWQLPRQDSWYCADAERREDG